LGNWERNSPSLAVALNCGTGSCPPQRRLIGPYPRDALWAPNHAKKNLPMVPAPRRRNPKVGALEAAKNVAAAMAVTLHARVEAHCCRLHADLAESTEFAPFRARCFEPGSGSILPA